MNFRLFVISEDDLSPAEQITPEQIALISDEDNKKLYIWKGPYSPNYDEFKSEALYERLSNLFVNPNIFIIKDLTIYDKDETQIKEIKKFLSNHLPNLQSYNRNRTLKNIFLLQGLRDRIKEFKRYENSTQWRIKLSKLTSFWKLSIFNTISVFAAVLILILMISLYLSGTNFIFFENGGQQVNLTLWDLWLTILKGVVVICILIVGICFIVNICFIIFATKFPINPRAMNTISYRTIDNFEKNHKDEQKKKENISKQIKLPPTNPSSSSTNIELSGVTSTRGMKTDQQLKITLSAPKLPNDKVQKTKQGEIQPSTQSQLKNKDAIEYVDEDLGIPKVPMKKAVKVSVKDIDSEIDLKEENPDIKIILSECQICNNIVRVPVPKKEVENSNLPVVEISFIHGNPPHSLVVQLDHDFAVRRNRAGSVIFQDKK